MKITSIFLLQLLLSCFRLSTMASFEKTKKRIGGCAEDVVPACKKAKLRNLPTTSPVANNNSFAGSTGVSGAQAGFKEKIGIKNFNLSTPPRETAKSVPKSTAQGKTTAKNKCKRTSRHRCSTAMKKAYNEWLSAQENNRNKRKRQHEADLKL
jgi:hypothetical protein